MMLFLLVRGIVLSTAVGVHFGSHVCTAWYHGKELVVSFLFPLPYLYFTVISFIHLINQMRCSFISRLALLEPGGTWR